MIVRPVSSDNDMMPVWSADQMVTARAAVGISVGDNLRLMHGEWWEDEELGMLIPDYFANTVKQGDIQLFANYLSGAIAKMDGVKGVEGVEVAYDHRQLTYSCTLITDEGTDELEVELDGLL